MTYYIYINKENSIIDVRQEDTLENYKLKIEVNKEEVLNVLHMLKSKQSNQEVYYINEEFIINYNINSLIKELRTLRNKKIQETDYLFLVDNINIVNQDLINSKKIERQLLRDITDNLNTVEEVLEKINELK